MGINKEKLWKEINANGDYAGHWSDKNFIRELHWVNETGHRLCGDVEGKEKDHVSDMEMVTCIRCLKSLIKQGHTELQKKVDAWYQEKKNQKEYHEKVTKQQESGCEFLEKLSENPIDTKITQRSETRKLTEKTLHVGSNVKDSYKENPLFHLEKVIRESDKAIQVDMKYIKGVWLPKSQIVISESKAEAIYDTEWEIRYIFYNVYIPEWLARKNNIR